MIHEDRPDFMDSAMTTRPASEALLRSEIAFWQQMIRSCDAGHPPESLERMDQALRLAEYRLLELYRGRG